MKQIVEPQAMNAMGIHTPGILVQRVVEVPDTDKRIERRMVAQ